MIDYIASSNTKRLLCKPATKPVCRLGPTGKSKEKKVAGLRFWKIGGVSVWNDSTTASKRRFVFRFTRIGETAGTNYYVDCKGTIKIPNPYFYFMISLKNEKTTNNPSKRIDIGKKNYLITLEDMIGFFIHGMLKDKNILMKIKLGH